MAQAIANVSTEERELLQQLQFQTRNTEQMVARLHRRIDSDRPRARIEPEPRGGARGRSPLGDRRPPDYDDIHRYPTADTARPRQQGPRERQRTKSPIPKSDPVPEPTPVRERPRPEPPAASAAGAAVPEHAGPPLRPGQVPDPPAAAHKARHQGMHLNRILDLLHIISVVHHPDHHWQNYEKKKIT